VVGSLLSGVAPGLTWLVVSRGLQGFGGGIALPLGVALLYSAFPPSEQGMALGIFGIAAIVAPAVGPILGGWMVDHNLWRLIFFINPPVGLVGVVLGSIFLREQPSRGKPPLDILGLITEIIGFGAILYGASIAANRGWSSQPVLTWFGIGVAGLLAFGLIELLVAREPLLDLRLFGKRIFLNASLLGYVSTWALFGAEFLMPLYLQSLRGLTALQTGIVLLPLAITGGISVTVAGRLYDKLGPRPLVTAGFSLLAINTWQLSQLRADTPVSWILILLALRGLALGLTVQTTLVTALSVVPQRDLARGSSLSNASRNLVQAIGVAVLATVLASTLSPATQALQEQAAQVPDAPAGHGGLCQTAPLAYAAVPGAATTDNPQGPIPQGGPGALLKRACSESVAGFERAYTVTFAASLLALALGLMLPGWPFKWAGRRAADMPITSH
jgi:DHA2 family multidrug resistance protein